MARRIHVVINPGSGQPKPVLHVLNSVLRSQGIDWEISLTRDSGDAERLARRAVESGADVVASYGGDGTLMEVARGVMGTGTPLAILPGGTANLMSVELGIPRDLRKAVEIAADESSPLHPIDVGRVGEEYFLLRVGTGFPARKVQYADRKLKDRYGIMAYTIAAIRAIGAENLADYRLEVDDSVYSVRSRACEIYNAGNMGIPGSAPVPGISVEDGLLDLLVLREQAQAAFLKRGVLPAVQHTEELFEHLQGRRISIEADPPQPVQVDGEIVGTTPVTTEILPRAIQVLVPKAVH